MKRAALAALLAVSLVMPSTALAAAPPSWNLVGSYTVVFTCTAGCAETYTHSMTIASSDDTTGAVAGSGSVDGFPGYDWTLTGTVSGSGVTFDVEWVSPPGMLAFNPMTMIGSIDSAGAMSGTASDGQGRTFDWATTAGAASPLPATHFVVSATSPQTAGAPFSFTVTAEDVNDTPVTGYTGTAHFTSSDGLASLPADYTFVGGDAGVHTFTNGATLNTTGGQTITATDTVTSSITGTSPTITVNAVVPVATQIRVETAPNGTGVVVPAQSLASGSAIRVYAISRDASNAFVANVMATWSLSSSSGGVAAADLVGSATSTTGTSAVFSGYLPGTATIRATSGNLTPTDSGVITVSAESRPGPPPEIPAPVVPFSQPAPLFAITKGAATTETGPFATTLTVPEGSPVWYRITLTNMSTAAFVGATLTDTAAGGGLPAGCAALPSPFAAGATYTCTYEVPAGAGTTTNTATASVAGVSFTATAAVAATAPVLVDAIAPGVNRGIAGFTTATVVLPAPGYVTYLVQLDPSFAGRNVEIWTRSKTGDWTLTTRRTVAADGTVHHFTRITAWTGFWAKLGSGSSHGRIGSVR